jgi:hypothetical protein
MNAKIICEKSEKKVSEKSGQSFWARSPRVMIPRPFTPLSHFTTRTHLQLTSFCCQAWVNLVKTLTDTSESLGVPSAAATQAIAAVDAAVRLCETNAGLAPHQQPQPQSSSSSSSSAAAAAAQAAQIAAAAAAEAVVTGMPAMAFDFSDAFVLPGITPVQQVKPPSAKDAAAAEDAEDTGAFHMRQ